MAQVDYFAVQEAIQTQLNNSLTTANVSVNIEPIDDPDGVVPWIGIYLEEANWEDIRIGGTTPHEVNLSLIVECIQFDINKFKNACEKRDDFIKEVTEVLLLDRTLQGTVTITQVNKITFENGSSPDDVGFFAIGEIYLDARLKG